MPTIRSRSLAAAVVAAALLLAACGGGDDAAPAQTGNPPTTPEGGTDPGAPEGDEQPVVVASTSWVAAFVRAAGIEEVTVVAPADLQHPPDYDPRPSDLAAVADADFVVLAGFEGFAERLTEAAGSGAELITITAENTLETIRAEVTALAEAFGTTDAAAEWLDGFETQVADLRAQVDAARPDPAPTAIVHVFMAYWAGFAGLEVVGTYGPAPVTASELAELTGAQPDLVLANAHVPAGDVFADLGATRVDIVNFPGGSYDLLEVFAANTAALVAALSGG